MIFDPLTLLDDALDDDTTGVDEDNLSHTSNSHASPSYYGMGSATPADRSGSRLSTPNGHSTGAAVEPLHPEEIRWMYRSEGDAVRKKWTPFIGYDSLRIECKYREMRESLRRSDCHFSGPRTVACDTKNRTFPDEGIPTRTSPGEKIDDESESEMFCLQKTSKTTVTSAEFISRGLETAVSDDKMAATSCSGASGNDVEGRKGEELVVVMGGLYEVDVATMKCAPVYWTSEGATSVVTRGRWFYEGTPWQPIEDDLADQIETEHLLHFESGRGDHGGDFLAASIQQNGNNDVDKLASTAAAAHCLTLPESYVEWLDVDQVYLYNQKVSSKLYKALSRTLRISKTSGGIRLRRGYSEEARMIDRPADVSHLVFIVHGIGQRMYAGSILKTCTDFREACKRTAERCFPQMETADCDQRVEFLPVEWRSSLTLDGDTVDSITPNKVRALRTVLNESAMDVLYYTSPLYRTEITSCLQTELNRLYEMFVSRQPNFTLRGGKVSIVAHSLGAVIVYDIITRWNPALSTLQGVAAASDLTGSTAGRVSELKQQLEEARLRVEQLERELLNVTRGAQPESPPALRFKVENCFTLGSPLAVFLALRGFRPNERMSQDRILPRTLCTRLFNLFHPSDPIAYRLEPLILKHYSTIEPLRIHRIYAASKLRYDLIPPHPYKAGVVAAASPPSTLSPARGRSERGTNTLLSYAESSISAFSQMRGGGKSHLIEDAICAEMELMERYKQPSPERGPGGNSDDPGEGADTPDNAASHPELEYRLDYMLKVGKMENAYISALTSHTAYWTNQDVALFVLTQIFSHCDPV